MTLRQVQGFALIACAILGILGSASSDIAFVRTFGALSTLLFVFGLPAVYTSQPIGPLGLLGVVLMIAAAVIATGFILLDIGLNDTQFNIMTWTSAISGFLGSVLVGWQTTRQNVFPAWVGWVLIADGVVTLASSLLGSTSTVLWALGITLGAMALFGYGYYLSRKNVTTTQA